MSGVGRRVGRRRFLGLAAGAAGMAGAIVGARGGRGADSQPAAPPPLAEIPRAETLVVAGGGGEAVYAFPDADHANVFRFDGTLSRSGPHLAYESLALVDAATGEPRGWLAERWATNDDATELTFTIREGIAWSDGTPFTAADPAFTLTMLQAAPPTVAHAVEVARWVAEAVAVDDRTLRVRLTEPNRHFLAAHLSAHPDGGIPIVPAHVWAEEDPTAFANLSIARGWPVVTGPYRLVASSPGDRLWDRRDDWWAVAAGLAPLPAPRRLVFWTAPEASRLAQAIAVDAADLTAPLPPSTMAALLGERPAATTATGREPPFGAPDPWPITLGFNCLAAPFDDRRVRRALSLAVDRVALAERGAAAPADSPFPATPAVAPLVEAVRDLLDADPTTGYDPGRAAALLAEAGYERDAEGYFARNRRRLRVSLVAPMPLAELAALVAAQFRRAGLEATAETPADYVAQVSYGVARVWLAGHGLPPGHPNPFDPAGTLRRFHGRYAAELDTPAAHAARWANPEYDALVDRLAALPTDDPAYREVFRGAFAIWLDALPEAPLLRAPLRIAANTTYWTGWPAGDAAIPAVPWRRDFALALGGLTTDGGGGG